MTIQERLTEDLGVSMKAGDTAKTSLLRLLRSAMKNEEIRVGHPLSDDEALKVLQREAKQRRDSIDQYRTAGRTELAAAEEAELVLIQGYLPQLMDESELAAVIDEVITEQGATQPAQMGAVIGAVMQRVGARAEGGVVSRLVKERLSAS
ncbi:MAG TPA: GatB/YqeY domain-containing protein [Candidatus Saccharimonas sp.]|nr:GatB/YqeY domain-containing protein [Candidatus Saccharimonas sp.]